MRAFLGTLLTAAILVSAGEATASARTIVTLGFDDGLSTQYQNRALLSSRGIPATFYISTGKLGQPGYMTWDQVAEMAADGHEIGGHTLTHARLAGLAPAQQRTQICDDRAALVARGYNAVSFAYPYGADDASAQSIAQSCGYTSARTTRGIDWPSCDVCAETLPPRFPYATRAVQANASVTTDGLKLAVTNAEEAGGAWLQLVLHDICDGCDDYGVPASTLAPFFDWLIAEQAAGRIVLMTAGQAMGGTTPPPDTTAPTVALTAPEDGASVSGPTTLTATAGDDVGVARVDFLVNGEVVGSDASAPYSASWDPASVTGDSANITARAVDAAGNATTTAARTVTITRTPPADTTAPAVALTAPAAGARVSGTVTVSANATDAGGVARVEFLVNGAVVATDTSAPYSAAWNTATTAGSTATITARAVDVAGNVATSAARSVTIVRDTTAPAVALTAPAAGARVSGTVTVSANATDAGGVARVEFLVNGAVVATDTSAPYSAAWNTATTAGSTATITARAVDVAGNVATSAARSVTIVRDTTAPAVALTAPAAGARVSGTVTVSANATDAGGVARVEFLVNGAVVATDTSAPYSAAWNTATTVGSTATITARAVDVAGNVATSAARSVTIAGADTTPPTVRITSPANNASVSGPLTINVTATDDVGVTQVRFYIDGTLRATDTSAPYTITGSLSRGTRTLFAEAVDAAGNVTRSSSVTVRIT